MNLNCQLSLDVDESLEEAYFSMRMKNALSNMYLPC